VMKTAKTMKTSFNKIKTMFWSLITICW
jgi:hypothetical protein